MEQEKKNEKNTSNNSSPKESSSESSAQKKVFEPVVEREDIEEDDEEIEDDEDVEEGELDDQPEGPRFDFIDGFFFIILAALKDVLDSTWIFGAMLGGIIILFLYLKQVPMVSKSAIAMLIDMIPVLGFLPITLVTAVVTVIMTNHPKAVEKLGFAGEVAEKIIRRKK